MDDSKWEGSDDEQCTHAEVYSKPCQTSNMERFVKIVNRFWPLTIFTKQSILDVPQGSEYASDMPMCIILKLAWVSYAIRIDTWSKYLTLTRFLPLASFYTPWKHKKNSSFLMFSGGMEREQWHEMDLKSHVSMLLCCVVVTTSGSVMVVHLRDKWRFLLNIARYWNFFGD